MPGGTTLGSGPRSSGGFPARLTACSMTTFKALRWLERLRRSFRTGESLLYDLEIGAGVLGSSA